MSLSRAILGKTKLIDDVDSPTEFGIDDLQSPNSSLLDIPNLSGCLMSLAMHLLSDYYLLDDRIVRD